MATPAWVPLATTTLSSTASSVTFSSIPAGYRDLRLIIWFNSTVNAQGSMNFNGDGGNNYSRVAMWGTGSTAGSGTQTGSSVNIAAEATITSTNAAMCIIDIMDYSATDKHKTGMERLTATADVTLAQAFRWANTAAINSISLTSPFASGATFSLWGRNAL